MSDDRQSLDEMTQIDYQSRATLAPSDSIELVAVGRIQRGTKAAKVVKPKISISGDQSVYGAMVNKPRTP